MTSLGPGSNLLGPPPTRLPSDPEPVSRLKAGTDPAEVAAAFPASSFGWAALAQQASAAGSWIQAYAYARVGYHRGLDSLRRAGWKGTGPVPWSHQPNRGFLVCVAELGRAAAAIGEQPEVDRCRELLLDCDPTLDPAATLSPL